MQTRTGMPKWSPLALAGFIALGGCAAPAQMENMVPPDAEVSTARADSPLRGAIAIGQVGGGEKPSSDMTYSTVGGRELEEALSLSLRKAGFLYAGGAQPLFQLEVFLVEIRRPSHGFTMIATSFVRYKLTRTRDGKVVYDDVVSASAKKTVSDEPVGVTRDRVVLESTVRGNIAAFLRALNTLDAAAR